jgi:hypothetical protein
MVDYDDDNIKVDSSAIECIAAAGRSIKCQAQPLIDHFKRLLEEACLNHVYPIKHKLKDYIMMKNFMTSGYLARYKEPEQDPGANDAMPFLGEDSVMTEGGDTCPT